MPKDKRWGVIQDCHGSVHTFMKYKANFLDATAFKGGKPDQKKLIRFVVSSCINGGCSCINLGDFGELGNST